MMEHDYAIPSSAYGMAALDRCSYISKEKRLAQSANRFLTMSNARLKLDFRPATKQEVQ